jgi:hypothetical protein
MSDPIEDRILNEVAEFEMTTGRQARYIVAGGIYWRSIFRSTREQTVTGPTESEIKFFYGYSVVRVEDDILMIGS